MTTTSATSAASPSLPPGILKYEDEIAKPKATSTRSTNTLFQGLKYLVVVLALFLPVCEHIEPYRVGLSLSFGFLPCRNLIKTMQ